MDNFKKRKKERKGQLSVWTSAPCSELIEARKVSAEVLSGQIITFHQAHSNSLHPPAQNKRYRLNPFLPTPHSKALSIKSYEDLMRLLVMEFWLNLDIRANC